VDLLDVIFQSILGNKLLLTERALSNLIMTMFLEYVPPEVAYWECLVAELALDFLPVVGQDVLVQVHHLLATDVAGLSRNIIISSTWLYVHCRGVFKLS